jgi:UDP-2,3-diacylglucosamine pyrophosphatase LpxH
MEISDILFFLKRKVGPPAALPLSGLISNPPIENSPDGQLRYRTIWISDFHLGTRNTQAAYLLDFLKNTESETLYLVGDIIDGWQLRKSWYWPQTHNDVIQKILRKARKGTRVFLIAGNHDEFLRQFGEHEFGHVTLTSQAIHKTADGKSLLVIHGDQFDNVIKFARWLALLGDQAYEVALNVNRWLNHFRLKMGYKYWSLSAYLKHKVKDAVNFISAFEEAVASESRRFKVDGVVCGHVHKAEIRLINGFLYCNDGDWVESSSALVEHFDGRLEIISWIEGKPQLETQSPGLAVAGAAR